MRASTRFLVSRPAWVNPPGGVHEAAAAQPVDYGGQLCLGQVVDPAKTFSALMPRERP